MQLPSRLPLDEIRDLSVKTTVTDMPVTLTEGELAEKKTALYDIIQELAERKAFKTMINEVINGDRLHYDWDDLTVSVARLKITQSVKVLAAMQEDVRTTIAKGYEEREMQLAEIPFFEEGIMGRYCTATGKLIDSRPLRPEEKQTNIFHLKHVQG